MEINELGKGAKEKPHDPRNWQLSFLASAPAPVDWNVGVTLPEPPDANQWASDACTVYAFSYAHWQKKRKVFNKRAVFCQVALPPGQGAYLEDPFEWVEEHGQITLAELPDPQYPDIYNMRDKSGIDYSLGEDDQALSHFYTDANPDQIGQAVRDWGGCVIGVYGTNSGWKDKTNPKPPVPGTAEWAHALYCFGVHMHDGKKCVIAKSSWCDSTHNEHHLKIDYFNAGAVFRNALVPVFRSNMVNRYLVRKGGKLGVLVSVDGDGIFADTVLWAKSEAHLAQLKAQYEIPADAKTLTYPL